MGTFFNLEKILLLAYMESHKMSPHLLLDYVSGENDLWISIVNK